MVSDNPTEERRRLLLSAIAQSRGYYPPPQPSAATNAPAVNKQPAAPSGFAKAYGAAKTVLGPVFQLSKAVDALLPGTPGSDVKKMVSDVPVIGKPSAEILDSLLSPFSLATLGYGSAAGAALRGGTAVAATGGFSKFAAPLVEPLVQGPLAARVGAEVGMQLGAQAGSTLAEKAGLPAPLQVAAGLVGGAGGLRVAANVHNLTRLTPGGLLPEEVTAKLESGDAVDKLTGLLSQARVNREDLTTLRKQEMGKRIGSINQSLNETMNYEQRAKTIAQGLQGQRVGMELQLPQVEPTDIQAIMERTSNYFKGKGDVLEEGRAYNALKGMFFDKRIPQANEIATLSEALGPDFGKVLANLAEPRKLLSFKTALEVAGIPRAVMASGDLSMPFRQGVLGITRKSYWNAWKPMGNALGDEQYAKDALLAIEQDAHPMTGLLKSNGVLTLPSAAKRGLSRTEEQFTSQLADVIPGVKQSQRAAVTFLDKFRNDYAKGLYDDLVKKGIEPTPKQMQDIADWTGIITGRGQLPVDMGKFGELMNTLFFSPKMMYARLQALNPMTYAKMDPAIRKEAMRDMTGFFMMGASALGLAGVAAKAGILPNTTVELDPRSSDFGRIKVGQTRIDPWGGFQPYARYIAQLGTGQSKNSYGDIQERDRASTLFAFGRGKLAPVPSFIVDALTGTSFIGESVDVGSGQGLDRAAAERLVPMVAQDITDAYKAGGYMNAALALPSFFGVTVQSYNSPAAIQQAGAKEMYKKDWTDLTGIEKAAVKDAYKEQLAMQTDPQGNTLTAYIERINDDTRQQEQALYNGLSGTGNHKFNAAMTDLMTARYNTIKGAMGMAGVDKATGTPDVLDRYFALSEAAKTNGIIDYEKLDQLQADFLASATPDERKIVEERSTFAHIPEVKWWADSKKVIANSDYYKIQGQVMDKLDPLVQKIAPGATTYAELVAAANQADPGRGAIIANLLKRVDSLTKVQQQAYRLQHPEVDSALTLVYGSKPIIAQLARI